ncbi:MAG: glycosyltransferase family 39 protein [Kiritimatiellia bacterium]
MDKKNKWQIVLGSALLVLFLSGQGFPLHGAIAKFPLQTAAVFTLAAFAVTGRRYEMLRRCTGWIFSMPRLPFNALLFAVSCTAYVLVALLEFKGIPRIDDGMAALFQARIFARGKITLPLPEDAGFFEVFGVLGQQAGLGHWCGMYPPGWPLLLTPGVWLGVPWLVNPVLGGLLVVTISELGRSFYDERTGRLAALMVIPSPLIAVLSGLHLSHIPTALALGLCLLSLKKLWQTERWFWGGAAGLLWGFAFLCRPLDAAVMGAIFALAFFFPASRFWRCRGGIAAGMAAALLAIAALFIFQEITTHDWRTPGHVIGMGERGDFGFGRIDRVRTHTPAIAIQYSFMRLDVLNENLTGWPWPALALVILPFILRRARAEDWLFLLPLPALLLTFACYWYYESCVPGRYLTPAFPFLFVLASSGFFSLKETLSRRGVWTKLPSFMVVSGVLFLGISTPAHLKLYPLSFLDVEDVLPRVVRDYGITNAVVFMDSVDRDQRRPDQFNDYYATGFMRNDLDLTGDVLYVQNSRDQNIRMAKRHPDRTFWMYRFNRALEKAFLYRLEIEDEKLRMIPVKPATRDLLEAPEVEPH